MTNWIFGGVAGLIFIIIAILIAVAVYIPSARQLIIKLIAGFVVVVFMGGSVYCGIHIDKYLNAEGGIFGYISGLVEINTTTKLEDMKFSLNNIVLTQEDGDKYSAIIYPSEVITLENDKNYTIYVNDIPLIPIESSEDFIIADYSYKFFNEDMTVALEDNLRFNLSFDDYITTFKITTLGGQTAVNYWNNYFTKNRLTIEIKAFNYNLNDDMNIVEGDLSNFYYVNYIVDSEEYLTQVYQNGNDINLINAPEKDGYVFVAWKDNEGNVIEEGYKVKSELNLYAEYTYKPLDFVIVDNAITGYTGKSSEILIPETYSLFEEKPVAGNDFKITSIAADAFKSNKEITRVVINENITKIGERAFFDCSNLSELVIGENVVTIGSSAFAGTGISYLYIPDSVTTIGGLAFFMCNSLKEVIVGTGIQSLSYSTFEECSSLSRFIIKAVDPPVIDMRNNLLPNTVKIYVPDEAYDSYKSSSEWSIYTILKQSEL